MHILLAHNEYGRPSGEESAVRATASLLEAHGHRVEWFLRSSAEIKSLTDKLGAFFSGISSSRARREMASTLDRAYPDLVQVQNLYPLLSPSILTACHERGVPIVMRCPNYRLFCPNSLHLSHGEICERCLGGKEYWCVIRNCERDYLKSLGYALRNAAARISRRIVDNVDVFIVLSKFQKQRFVAGGIEAERIEILPNLVPDVGRIAPQNTSDLVTFVGRASPEKGIGDFVEAARALPNLPFAVAGATERMPELVARSPSNVRWLGFQDEKDLQQTYARSRVLVFPFRWFEGFPNVITRAMVMEKPVIAARIGAIPEIVTDGKTGLLFQPGDVGDLVTRIKELYADKTRCQAMGMAGRFKAQAEYSREIVYRRLMEIYQKAISQHARQEQNPTRRSTKTGGKPVLS